MNMNMIQTLTDLTNTFINKNPTSATSAPPTENNARIITINGDIKLF